MRLKPDSAPFELPPTLGVSRASTSKVVWDSVPPVPSSIGIDSVAVADFSALFPYFP